MTRSGRLRREAPILLPASLLLFALLASVTLWSYRSAVAAFAAERERSALGLATSVAEALRQTRTDELVPAARWLPRGSLLALYDEQGALLSGFGFAEPTAQRLPFGMPAEPLVERFPLAASTSEPAAVVRASVPFRREGRRYLLRLEIPEPELFAQTRSLRILTPVVFGLAAAVALLAIFFFRALVRPYEQLLDRVRAAVPATEIDPGGGPSHTNEAEVEELLAVFDRALVSLRERSAAPETPAPSDDRIPAAAPGSRPGTVDDERAAIAETLGPRLESGLLLFDGLGNLIAANAAAVALLGGEPPAEGPALAACTEALSRHPELARRFTAALAEGRTIPRAATTLDLGDRTLELGWSLQALRRGEAVGGYLALLADTTDLSRRESEARFSAGLAQLGELSAGVAHELRNSLATLQGYLDLASRRALPEAAREDLAEARLEAAELARIVDDFLTFARPSAGAVEPFDLVSLLRRAAHDPALAGDVEVLLELPDSPVTEATGDPHLLLRALRNLLLNAVQASAAKAAAGGTPGAVRLELRGEPEGLAIAVDDGGSGLTPEVRRRLFEPFASGRAGGAGLGLALARRIVLMHGGSLTLVESSRGGVRAEVRLPAGKKATKGSAS